MPANCALTQGFNLDCDDNVGGVEVLYIGELDEVASSTIVAGKITAMAMNTTKQFFTFQVTKEDAEATETEQKSVENGTLFYEQATIFTMKKMSLIKRNEVRLLATNRTLIMFKDNLGTHWMYGFKNGCDKVGTNEAKTGKTFGDMNGYMMGFLGKEPVSAYEVDPAVVATLIVPAV